MQKLTLSTICIGLVVTLCLLTLAGWQFDVAALRSLLPGTPETPPLTALMLLTLGLALMASRQSMIEQDPVRWRWVCRALVAVAVVVAAWTTIQYLFGLGPSLELLLFRQRVLEHSETFPGRPSPQTIFSCVFIGLSIALSPEVSQRASRTRLVLGLLGMVVPWLALYGYTSRSLPFYAMPDTPEIGMSLVTALGFILLWVGKISLHEREGIIGLLRASTSGGVIARLLLPVTIAGPLLFGGVIAYGREAGWFDTATGFALNWGMVSLLFAGSVIWLGFVLHHRDLERAEVAREREKMLLDLEKASEQVRHFNVKLEARVEQMTGELCAQNTELENAHDELQVRNAALEHSNLELQQFAYITSHDLQSPLRRISGFVQLLQRTYAGQLDERADQWIEHAVEGTRELQTLIQSILAYSRVDARARPFEPTPLDEVFDQAVQALGPSIRDANAEVTRETLPVVMGDPVQLMQVLQNLIGNAVKYQGEEPPRIHVTAEREGGGWIIAVKDNGIGIDPMYHQQIFELFRRLHSQQEYPGTGIGLSICRRVIERHGGTLRVKSALGEGSTFYVAIPAMETAEA